MNILAIGTEVTSGQIINKNAAWMSEKLNSYGMEVFHHLSVPDERELMINAMRFLTGSNHLFITGGLGPTSDDFTREVVAEFAKKPLVFDPSELGIIE